jgi:SAM-dependent methyltransferase
MFSRSADLYDALYARFKDYEAEAARLRELIAERVPEARTLLDVACGTGTHLAVLREHFEVEGLDIDPKLLAIARERLPGVPLHEGDMTGFDVGRRFDAVVNLFSSIGYVGNEERLHASVAAMARHLEPGGLLVVEPFFAPEVWDVGRVSMLTVDEPERKVVRVALAGRRGDLSTIEFHYLVATSAGIEHFNELHELALFTDAQYRDAFAAAGLRVDHDEAGLMGRGLYIGRPL